eukprot:1124574-Rhodomonas_salina.1
MSGTDVRYASTRVLSRARDCSAEDPAKMAGNPGTECYVPTRALRNPRYASADMVVWWYTVLHSAWLKVLM